MAACTSLDDLWKGLPPEKLDKPCKDSHLCDISLEIADWKSIAPFLHITEVVQREIESEGSMRTQRVAMLRRWKKKYGSRATYRKLATVFWKLERADLVDEICSFIADSDSSSSEEEDTPPLQAYKNIRAQYAAQLRRRYRKELPNLAQWPPSPSRKFFNLAMIHRQRLQLSPIEEEHIRLTQLGKVDDIMLNKSAIRLQDIFHTVSNHVKRLVVLIDGAPGAGKSTLAWYICEQWGSGNLFGEFKLVVFVQLRNPAVQNATSIADLLPRTSNGKEREVLSQLEIHGGKGILFVLDGWDEYTGGLTRNSICGKLICNPGDLYMQESTLLITSRPVASGELQLYCSTRIEIIGFAPKEVKEYFKEALREVQLEEQAEVLQECLKVRPVIQASCYLPLNAAIVVHLFIIEGNTLPTTLHDLFTSLVLNCIVRHLKKTSQGEKGHLPKITSFENIPTELQANFNAICALAYHGIMTNKASLSEEELHSFGLSTESSVPLLSLIQGWSTFKSSWEDLSYSFFHLSVQELLAAFHISKQPHEHQVKVFRKLFGQPRFAAVLTFYAAFTKLVVKGIRNLIREMLRVDGSAYSSVIQAPSVSRQVLQAHGSAYSSVIQAPSASRPMLKAHGSAYSSVIQAPSASRPMLQGHGSAYSSVSELPRGELHKTILDCLFEAQDASLCQYVAMVMEGKLTVDYTMSPFHCMVLGYFLHCLCLTPGGGKFRIELATSGLDKYNCSYLINELRKCSHGQLALSLCEDGQGRDYEALLDRVELDESLDGREESGSLVILLPMLQKSCSHCISELSLSLKGRGYLFSRILLQRSYRIPVMSLCIERDKRTQSVATRRLDAKSTWSRLIHEERPCPHPQQHRQFVDLVASLAHTPVKELSISNCTFQEIDSITLADFLTTNKTLRSFGLSNCTIPLKGIKAIANCLKTNATLMTLRVSNCVHSEDSTPNLLALDRFLLDPTPLAHSLLENKTLRTFDISGSTLSQQCIQALAECLDVNQTLEILNLSECDERLAALQARWMARQMFPTSSVEQLSASLGRNHTLKCLNLSGRGIVQQILPLLPTDLAVNKTLETLVLSHNILADADFDNILATLRQNSGLKTLDLSHCLSLYYSSWKIESIFTASHSLETLILSGINLSRTDDQLRTGAHYVGQGLRQNSSLRSLSIAGCRLTDHTMEVIVEALEQNPCLQELDFSRNDLTVSGLRNVCERLQNIGCLHKVTPCVEDIKTV